LLQSEELNRENMMAGLLIVFLTYLHFFLEWVFYITKPSFLAGLDFSQSLGILFITPLPVILLELVLLAIVIIFSKLTKSRFMLPLIPACILAAILFILIDNFTHTVFGFYIGSFTDNTRYLYACLFLGLIGFGYWQLTSMVQSDFPMTHRNLFILLCITLPAISSMFALAKIAEEPTIEVDLTGSGLVNKPNILILSTDGLKVDNMSAYGYERPTTPAITALAKDSLVSENSFPNGANTTGSVGGLLSGKLPTKTGVIYTPSIFQGIHSYQHFAGLLKQAGYRSIDLSIPVIADSYDLNMQGAFDVVNARDLRGKHQNSLFTPKLRRIFAIDYYFLQQVIERIDQRVKHSFGNLTMVDSYREVVDTDRPPAISDEKRLSSLISFIKVSEDPFFAHIHFMGTHGPRFRPISRKYSKGQVQEKRWMTDFYDDAIFDFDNIVGRISHYLKQKKLYDNTLIIITSDHGIGWRTYERLPFVIKFPNSLNMGKVDYNTQRADIPPTLLDYLNSPIPEWMDGISLLGDLPDENRMIFAAFNAPNEQTDGQYSVKDYGPPYYALGKVSVVQCNHWWQLNLITGELKDRQIENQIPACTGDIQDPLTDENVPGVILQHLKSMGYDTSQLRIILNNL
jgi:hypothetical protein